MEMEPSSICGVLAKEGGLSAVRLPRVLWEAEMGELQLAADVTVVTL